MSGCKGGCGGCCGSCGSCGGNGALVLAPEEIAMLNLLGQIPFLPVARRGDSVEPVYFGEGELTGEKASLAIQCLEKRNLISVDYDQPLPGAYGPEYDGYPIRGSFALTAKGQQVLELLEIQGAD